MPTPSSWVESRSRGGGRALHARAVAAETALEWLRSCAGWFGPGRRELPGAREVTRAHRRLALVETQHGELVAKREAATPLRRLGLRTTRSERAFRTGHALLAAGLATPEPLACLLPARAGDASATPVLLTRRVAARDAFAFLADEPGARDALFEALGAALARLHAAGFRQRDLKAPNVLVARGAQGALEVTWIDLEGVGRPPRLGNAHRRRDLARLCASLHAPAARAVGLAPDDAAVLVAAYGSHAALPEARRWLPGVRAWAERHAARNAARGRPLT